MRKTHRIIITCVAVLWVAACVKKPLEPALIKSIPTAPVALPKDLAAHEWAKQEWWYYSGHLEAEDGRTYGFEISFFRYRFEKALKAVPKKVIKMNTGFMAHFAVVDETTGKYYPAFVMIPEGKLTRASTEIYDLKIINWYANGDDKVHNVFAKALNGMSLTIEATPLKPPVLHCGTGICQKSDDLGNYYMSYTRMAVKGIMQLNGEEIPVKGLAWFDHEFGYMGDIPIMRGWDWYSIQLDNNTEYMIYTPNKKTGGPETFSNVCRIDENGAEECIPFSEITIEPLGLWVSPRTEAAYPSGWRVKMPKWNEDLIITPTSAAQEYPYPPIIYWEGSCKVLGSHTGRAYIELVGYAPKNIVIKKFKTMQEP